MTTQVESKYRFPIILGLLFGTLLIGIPSAGYYYYTEFKKHFREQVDNTLTSIGELKIQQISQWRKERLGNAELLYKNNALSAVVKEYLQHPEQQIHKVHLLDWMSHIQRSYEFDRVAFNDRTNAVRVSVPVLHESLSTTSIERSAEAMATRKIVFQDFYRHSSSGRVFLKIFIPVLDNDDSSRVLGTITLRIDPEKFLYPMLRTWPVPTRTAETLILRRDGDEIVFLNKLRFSDLAPLEFKIPIHNDSIAAVKAALGVHGVIDAIDYRGNVIFAYVSHIPDSPWFFVARMNIDEVYEPLQERFWITVTIVFVMLLGTGSGFGMLWRHQRALYYQQLYLTSERLDESDRRFKTVFDHSPVGKSITNVDGTITANNSFCTMLGYTLEEMSNIPWKSITHPDDIAESKRIVDSLLRGERDSTRFEKRYLRKNGSIVWADVNTFLQRDKEGKPQYFITIVNDITQRKQAEQDIILLNEKLEERVQERTAQLESVNKELEAFAYSISHDLRAPLRAIDGFAQAIMDDYASSFDPEAMRLFSVIRTNAQRMDDLITDILTLSRASRSEMKRSRIDMAGMARAMFHEIAPPKEAKEFTLTVDPIDDASGDPSLMRQVWSNLLSNAIKYTKPKQEKRIAVRSRRDNGTIVYSVEDTGVGFNPEYRHKLFGLFQRLHKQEEFEGNGVGLAIVQRIILRHGGTVWAEGKPNEGASFYFTLPIKEDHNE